MVATRSRSPLAPRIGFKKAKRRSCSPSNTSAAKKNAGAHARKKKQQQRGVKVAAAAEARPARGNARRGRPKIEWPEAATAAYEGGAPEKEERLARESLSPSPSPSAADSEDTILVGVGDHVVGAEDEVMSPEAEADFAGLGDSSAEEEDAKEESGGEEGGEAPKSYEGRRQQRMLKNKAMIKNLGISGIAKSRRPARRAASSRRANGVGKAAAKAEPSRRSGRSRKKVDRLGNFADEEELELIHRRRNANPGQRGLSAKPRAPRRVTRAESGKQSEAKRVYKKVLKKKAEEKQVELKCSPLTADKLEWARQEMIQAYATEYKLDGAQLAFVTQSQKDAMVVDEGRTVVMSKVAKEMSSFVLSSPYSDYDTFKRSGYKSPSAYFGAPEGVPVGTLWLSRVECSKDAVHGPWVGGIAGSGKTGAYSIVLSGGYEGDTDDGTAFTYTGSGGRDLTGNKRTAPQSSDQELKGGNLALAINLLRRRPLRVVRGYKLKSAFAPRQGYRYDGLYNVVEVWPEQGPSGFVIWRYKLERQAEQEAAPWERESWEEEEGDRLQLLEQMNGQAPLIPIGTGTLGLNKEFKELASNLGL